MTSVPTRQSPEPTQPGDSIEQRFQHLAAVWRAETAHLSSTTALVAHTAFQAIVSLGPPVIPVLLRELERGSDHWHRALKRITGVDPVPVTDRGDIRKTAESWARWGRENGYEW